jgi:serine/threonine protein kinase
MPGSNLIAEKRWTLTDYMQDPSYQYANTYVLKTYRFKDAKENCETEVKAFRALMSSGSLGKSIIGFFGSIEQDGSYNVLLEYADGGTLEDYLQKTPSPTTGHEICKFWSAFFNVIKALTLIHNVRGKDPKDPPILQGQVSKSAWSMSANAYQSLQMASGYQTHQYSRH